MMVKDATAGVEAALAQAEKPNYLGSQRTVAALVQWGYARIVEAKAAGKLDAKVLNGTCLRIAGVLLGEEPGDYAPGPLNSPGRLDLAIRERTGFVGGDAKAAVADAVYRCLLEVAKADGQPEPALDGAMAAAVALLMGVALPSEG